MQTGSGKTAAYLLPCIQALCSRGPPPGRGRAAEPGCVVLAPTRELTQQILEDAQRFCWKSGMRVVGVFGGEGTMSQQLSELSRGCDLLIATPGRLLDLADRGKVRLGQTSFLVLDEADRMLDMGFEPQIRDIVDKMPDRESGRQTLMFSATFPTPIQQLAQDFLRDYIFICVGKVGAAAETVTQRFAFVTAAREKPELLMDILAGHGRRNAESTSAGLTLIFVQTKRAADELEYCLQGQGFAATTIHGDRSQPERTAALASFKRGETPYLVATDVASRGLDIPHVEHVVNYDVPSDIDTYVHRIGRTGRAGRSGAATALINRYEDTRIAAALVPLLRDAGQTVPEELEQMAAGGSTGGGWGGRQGGGGGGWGGGGARAPTRDARQSSGPRSKGYEAPQATESKWLWKGPASGAADSGGGGAWDD